MHKKIVMCGCHNVGAELIPKLINAGFEFSYFVCLDPEQGRKNKVSGYYDFRDLASKHNIPVYIPNRYNLTSVKDIQFFENQNFDLLIQGGWQRLLPDAILNTLSIGAVGVHGSSDFLPKGRGRSPMNWSIIEGKKRFIAHLFLMKSGADDGDVFDYEDFDINEFDDIVTLYIKLAIVTERMILRSVPKLLEGSVDLRPQVGIPEHYLKRCPEDGEIKWEIHDVNHIAAMVRAQTSPYPGAFGVLNGKNYYVWKAQIFDTRIKFPEAKYGDVVWNSSRYLIVNCRGGLLLITEFQEKNLCAD